MGFLNTGHIFRCTRSHNLATAITTFGAKVNNPVGGLDNIQVVLNNHYGIAMIPQAMQDIQQLLDIVEVQARGGFIQNIQGFAGIPFG